MPSLFLALGQARMDPSWSDCHMHIVVSCAMLVLESCKKDAKIHRSRKVWNMTSCCSKELRTKKQDGY